MQVRNMVKEVTTGRETEGMGRRKRESASVEGTQGGRERERGEERRPKCLFYIGKSSLREGKPSSSAEKLRAEGRVCPVR